MRWPGTSKDMESEKRVEQVSEIKIQQKRKIKQTDNGLRDGKKNEKQMKDRQKKIKMTESNVFYVNYR